MFCALASVTHALLQQCTWHRAERTLSECCEVPVEHRLQLCSSLRSMMQGISQFVLCLSFVAACVNPIKAQLSRWAGHVYNSRASFMHVQ